MTDTLYSGSDDRCETIRALCLGHDAATAAVCADHQPHADGTVDLASQVNRGVGAPLHARLVLLLALVSSLALAACSGTPPKTSDSRPAVGTEVILGQILDALKKFKDPQKIPSTLERPESFKTYGEGDDANVFIVSQVIKTDVAKEEGATVYFVWDSVEGTGEDSARKFLIAGDNIMWEVN